MSQPALTASVVITSYNYIRYVSEAIESARQQSRPPLEIIVVDDGSTDGSPELLQQRYGEVSKLRLIFQANAGQLSAFATGIAAATGDIVTLLDADDLWEPNYLAEVLALYERQPDLDFVYTNLSFFGARSGPVLTDLRPGDLGISVLLGAYRTMWQGAPTSANSLRRELALRLVQVPPEMFKAWRTRSDDCLVCGADILGGHKYFLDRPLVRYRAHASNAWLGQGSQPIARLRHWLRVEAMLEHYRRMSGVQPSWLRHTKHEFRTKQSPSWREFRAYSELLAKSDLPWFKRLEFRVSMLGHWLRQRRH